MLHQNAVISNGMLEDTSTAFWSAGSFRYYGDRIALVAPRQLPVCFRRSRCPFQLKPGFLNEGNRSRGSPSSQPQTDIAHLQGQSTFD